MTDLMGDGLEDFGDLDTPLSSEARKAWIAAVRRKSLENYLEAIREHDETMKALEKQKGILERLFGIRTAV